MTNGPKSKGDRGERDVQQILRDFGIKNARRALGAGRQDDVGDIDNVKRTAIQVTVPGSKYFQVKLVEKLDGVEDQRQNRRVPFACVFIKRERARVHPWVVVMTPAMWFKFWKYAQIGWEYERRQKRDAVT